MSEAMHKPVASGYVQANGVNYYLTHDETFFAPEMARAVLLFLDRKSGSKSWAEQGGGSSA